MRVKEIKIDRKEFNLIVNDILLEVKPVKLRIKIANRLLEHFDNKQEQIEKLESKLAKFKSYKSTDERIRDLTNLYVQYKKDLHLYKKAFEMVCEDECPITAQEYYLEQARKELENE